jgi:hypothetical protein
MQDRRAISRLLVNMDCEFMYQDIKREAIITNLSLKGASLVSKCLPPIGTNISITLKTPLLEKTMTLAGKVTRSGFPVGSIRGRFGISFGYTPLELVKFVTKEITK